MMRRRLLKIGFTLIETVMAMAVLSMIMLACMSLLTICARTLNNRGRTDSTQAAAARVAMDQLTDDLQIASTFSEQTATSTTFTVPDRTGDGVPETIRYALVNNNFTRQINGSAAVTLVANPPAFSLTYNTKTVGTMPALESTQQIWAYYNDTATSVAGTGCDANHSFSEYVLPTIPSGTSSWKITHAKIQGTLLSNGKGIVNVMIETASSSKIPTGVILGTAPLDVTQFPTSSSSWADAWFSPPITGLTPGQGYCLVVSTSVMPFPCNVFFDNKESAASGSAFGGYAVTPPAAWGALNTSQALQFYLYGTYFTPQ